MSKQSNLINASQDITVDSSGNVGIGTNAPSKSLDVNIASATFRIRDASAGNDFSVKTIAGPVSLAGSEANTAIGFMTYGTERMRIDTAGRVTMPYQPCFSARGSGNLAWSSGSNIRKIIPLNSVPHNVGGHFSASTHRFTAPVAGNYFFAAKATQTGTVTGPSLFLYKNGGVYGFEIAIGYSVAYHSFGGEIIIPLAANDYVDMRISNNNNVAMTISLSRCSLSGFLIG